MSIKILDLTDAHKLITMLSTLPDAGGKIYNPIKRYKYILYIIYLQSISIYIR
jgi:hypothetical protein